MSYQRSHYSKPSLAHKSSGASKFDRLSRAERRRRIEELTLTELSEAKRRYPVYMKRA